MRLESVLTYGELPFCIGPRDEPSNPPGIPSIYPFDLGISTELGHLAQIGSPALEQLLRCSYEVGIEMGTPSDDTDLGRPYVLDFLNFVDRNVESKGRILEIGAGVGYISARLLAEGWQVDSVEPGRGYRAHWEKFGLKVINESFPTPRARGPYDAIVFYTVLEHIPDAVSFLAALSEYLAPAGKVILGVPDCTSEIADGDPTMLLHEHFHYFNAQSLQRILNSAGMSAHVERSAYGRCLYACGKFDGGARLKEVGEEELVALQTYASKARSFTQEVSSAIANAVERGSVGIYIPARALPFLRADTEVRFFDDSASLHGKFYPPFRARIESRAELLRNPPDSLFVMSRTFGPTLADELRPKLRHADFRLLHEFKPPSVQTVA